MMVLVAQQYEVLNITELYTKTAKMVMFMLHIFSHNKKMF